VIKGVLTFGLTRRPIVLLGLLVFLVAGLIALPTKRPGPIRSPNLGKGCGPLLARSSPRWELISAALHQRGPW
jgi:hypothetical protein